ncbi:helix-turn-helix domain-containing protein [Paracoccus sp. S-4012]|nr:helix-turn-helix domain-containing protein [Paracoccus sp. S-4012]
MRDTRADTTGEVLNDDARLYLRHVQGGETIRALAREAGCHASTIMRRIRRIEARRDDPLIDRALDGDARTREARASADELRRILRRLAESGAELAVADGMEKAIVTRDGIRTAVLDHRLAERLALDGWVMLTQPGRINRYAITASGREALRAMLGGRPAPIPRAADLAAAEPVGMAEAPAGFDHAARHPRLGETEVTDPDSGRRRRIRVNLCESPLQVLARRQGPDGKPFLSPAMISAGERLREDFEVAQMGPRTTQNWDRFLTAGIDVSRAGGGHGGGSDSARGRVAAALRELGPGMGDLVLRVCCFLEGIEATERRLGWSARSGKVVLRLALMRLARHYEETYGPGAPLIG